MTKLKIVNEIHERDAAQEDVNLVDRLVRSDLRAAEQVNAAAQTEADKTAQAHTQAVDERVAAEPVHATAQAELSQATAEDAKVQSDLVKAQGSLEQSQANFEREDEK